MSLKIRDRYGVTAAPGDADYPTGSVINDTVPGDNSGTPVDKDWYNDLLGSRDAILAEAGIEASGNPDTAQTSDVLDALIAIIASKGFTDVFDVETFAEVEALEPSVGTRVICRELANAPYIAQPNIYLPQVGDPIFANGLAGRLQIDSVVHVSQITTDRDQAAIQSSITRAGTEGALIVDLGDFTYDFSADGFVDLTGVSNLTIKGLGARINGKTSGTVENIIYGDACNSVVIEGVDFYGSTNHQISLRNPANCTIRNCNHYGQVAFAVLMFTPDRGVSGDAVNNHIINCFNDGQGLANGGFGMESMVDSTIVNPIVTGVTVADPGYAVNLKNECVNSHVYDHTLYGNANGMVYSDNGGGATGSGCKNCTSNGSLVNHSLSGMSLNKTSKCRAVAYIDQQDNNGGTDPAQHAGIAIQGGCEDDVITAEICNINSAQKAVNVRSSDITISISRYDLSSTNMLSLDATTTRVRTTLHDYDSSSVLFNPRDYIDDLGSNNEFTNMRRFRDNFLVCDVTGQDLLHSGLSGSTDITTMRAGGVAGFSLDNNLMCMGPASGQDNVFSGGRADRRYTELFAAAGTINTSDERQKTELLEIEESEKACALELKSNICKFQFLDAVEKKGADGARIHFGVGAQTVKEIFENHGLDANRYSLFCYDEWEATEAVTDVDGVVLEPAQDAGDAYGVKYDQLAMFILSAV